MFKPYYHSPTDRTYVDGATVRNNPVRIAYEEQKQIWNSDKPPDIIVSIGTGILVDSKGNVVEHRSARLTNVKQMLPRGVKKKIETGLDMVQATMDCHREWVEFESSLRGRLRKNSHRLDVGLRSKPPSLDDVQSMWELSSNTAAYLYHSDDQSLSYINPDYSLPRDHIRAVARRLLATLFYLSFVLDTQMKGGRYYGTMHCRLTPQSTAARALIAQNPMFRLREIGVNGEEAINPVIFLSQGSFKASTLSVPIEMRVTDGDFERLVEVQFAGRGGHWEQWEPIGGF